MATPITSRGKVLGLYRQLLRQARQIPKQSEREESIQEIKSTFKQNVFEKDMNPQKVMKLLKLAESKLGYLKIVTPRAATGQTGRSKFVLREGELVEGQSTINGRTLRAGIQEDDLQRHKYLLERQHFMHRK